MLDVFVGYVVPAVHVAACLFLIVVVLLQTGKGADIGAVFGGGSQTLFGASGAGNLLTKLTTGTAITFMITSLILTYGQTHAGGGILNRLPNEGPAPVAAPVTPPPVPAPAAAPEAEPQQEQPGQTQITIPVVPAPPSQPPAPEKSAAEKPAPEKK
jgi:preprotein translocase subunit SecG